MKNIKAEAIWQRLKINEYFLELVSQFRKTFLIPQEGFRNEVEYKKWLGSRIRNKKLRQVILFEEKIKKHNWGYDLSGMDYILHEYLYYDKIGSHRFSEANTTLCEWFIINSENIKEQKNNIKDGFYIRIDAKSRWTDIKLFLEQNKIWIDLYRKHKNTKPTKNKVLKHEVRDDGIFTLASFGKKELDRLTGTKGEYRESQIQKILKTKGINLSEETIKKITQKQRKLRMSRYI